jgi:hypothetical protein
VTGEETAVRATTPTRLTPSGRTSGTTTQTDTCSQHNPGKSQGRPNEKHGLKAHRTNRPTRLRSPNKAPVPDHPTLRPEPDRASKSIFMPRKEARLARPARLRRGLAQQPPRLPDLSQTRPGPPSARPRRVAHHRSGALPPGLGRRPHQPRTPASKTWTHGSVTRPARQNQRSRDQALHEGPTAFVGRRWRPRGREQRWGGAPGLSA